MKRTDSFVAYSGETTNELLTYPAQGQRDSLVRAFEEGLQRKLSRTGERALNKEERTILAVRALDREVNNGGYHQFFCNSSKRFAPEIVQSLSRIGCRRTAKITQRAINALSAAPLTVARIEAAMRKTSEERDRELERCDEWFYRTPQGIPRRLYAFIKTTSERIRL
ncbi:MAG: DMP19 family protein [Acidobacteriia bacterium]|nr:DMP19 family protein [Terriglobia bacterium]